MPNDSTPAASVSDRDMPGAVARSVDAPRELPDVRLEDDRPLEQRLGQPVPGCRAGRIRRVSSDGRRNGLRRESQ